jgi:hypothetical protein
LIIRFRDEGRHWLALIELTITERECSSTSSYKVRQCSCFKLFNVLLITNYGIDLFTVLTNDFKTVGKFHVHTYRTTKILESLQEKTKLDYYDSNLVLANMRQGTNRFTSVIYVSAPFDTVGTGDSD